MSTYLVAFIISEFRSLGDANFKVWARPSAIEQAHYALKIGIQALELFEKLFEQKYTLPKMDMVAVPDFSAGAMENWGLTTYRETRMLYDNESSALAQQSVASVIVHEITHMWFGNLVTPEWWGYLWLSEAFARYFQYFGTAQVRATSRLFIAALMNKRLELWFAALERRDSLLILAAFFLAMLWTISFQNYNPRDFQVRAVCMIVWDRLDCACRRKWMISFVTWCRDFALLYVHENRVNNSLSILRSK